MKQDTKPNTKQTTGRQALLQRYSYVFVPGHLILLLLQESTCTSGCRIWQRAHTALQKWEHIQAHTQTRGLPAADPFS